MKPQRNQGDEPKLEKESKILKIQIEKLQNTQKFFIQIVDFVQSQQFPLTLNNPQLKLKT